MELLLGRRAERLDAVRRTLVLDGGEELRFGRLLVATGSEPRRLPAAEGFDNVHLLRTLRDSDRLRGELRPGARLAVIGAGFIGQEVAATARRLGVEVTMIEAAEAPLAAILGVGAGGWFAQLHRYEGVELLLSTQVSEFRGRGRVEELRLVDGRTIECDAVLIGIGVRPALGWLVGSGLETETAIPVDAGGRTAIPEVFAAGDVAAPLDPSSGRHVRSEHWEAAARQGMAAARGMLGLDPVRSSISSFWSDQYGLRIQYLGDARAADAMSVDGEPSSRDFAAWFTRAGDPVAALLVGRPHALAAARRRIELSRQRNRPLNEGGVDEALVAAGG